MIGLTSFLPVKICMSHLKHKRKREFKGWTYINPDQVNLGVTVLASLRGGHLDDLARAACTAIVFVRLFRHFGAIETHLS